MVTFIATVFTDSWIAKLKEKCKVDMRKYWNSIILFNTCILINTALSKDKIIKNIIFMHFFFFYQQLQNTND